MNKCIATEESKQKKLAKKPDAKTIFVFTKDCGSIKTIVTEGKEAELKFKALICMVNSNVPDEDVEKAWKTNRYVDNDNIIVISKE